MESGDDQRGGQDEARHDLRHAASGKTCAVRKAVPEPRRAFPPAQSIAMRLPPRHLLVTFICVFVTGSSLRAQDEAEVEPSGPKFELAPSRSNRPLLAPPVAPRRPAAKPQPTPDPNVLDLSRTIQNSPLKAHGIVGRVDERHGIAFESGNVRKKKEESNAHQTSTEVERAGIIGVLLAFAIGGCWMLVPKRRKRRQRRRQEELARSRSRFSY